MSKNLHQRLAAAMTKVTYIQKEKKAGMRYSIVSHDSVTAKVRPALLEEGVIYYPIHVQHSQSGNRTECQIVMRFCNIDDPNDSIEVHSFGYGIDDQDKGPGKARSYAVKYALLKTLGLETGDDPDEDQASTYNNPVVAMLETALSMAVDKSGLADVGTQIKDHSTKLSQAEVARLRQMFLKRQQEIA